MLVFVKLGLEAKGDVKLMLASGHGGALLRPRYVSDAEVFLIAFIGLLASRKMARTPSADVDLMPRAALRSMEAMSLEFEGGQQQAFAVVCRTLLGYTVYHIPLYYTLPH